MEIDAPTVGLIIFGLISFGVIGLVIVRTERLGRQKRRTIERLLTSLGHFEPDTPTHLSHKGVDFQVFYKPARYKESAILSLTLPTMSGEAFRLSSEGATDRFFKGV